MHTSSFDKFLSTLVIISAMFFHSALHAQEAIKQQKNSAGKPWLGIAIDQGQNGVLVKGIMPDTPAEKAGFKVGDEVLKIDGKEVKDPRDLISIVQSSGIGQNVKVEILRNKKKLIKTLKLVLRPDELQLLRDRLIGKPAPDFNLDVIHGNESGSLKKMAGKVVIVEFWATWCPACRATHPRLSDFAAANPSIAVLAISDEEKETLKAYATKLNPKFTILRDADGKAPAEWLASAIPMICVIGKDGKVAFVTVGAGEAAEEALKTALSLAKP